MANMTLSIPDDIHAKMRKHSEVRWSEVARKAITERIEREEKLRWMDDAFKNSKLTPADVRKLGKKVNKAMAERFLGEDYPRRKRPVRRTSQ
jgi:hypothetical protein